MAQRISNADMKISAETQFLIKFFSCFVLVIWSVAVQADIVLFALLTILLLLFQFCLKDITRRSVLFAFGVAFFVFLVGREFLEVYLNIELDTRFSEQTNRHLYLSLLMSIISIWSAFYFFTKKHTTNSFEGTSSFSLYRNVLQKLSLVSFYISMPFVIIVNYFISQYVSKLGYYAYYTDFSELLINNTLLYAMSKMDIVCDVSFCTFLATLPSKKRFTIPCISYFLILLSSIGTGQRSTLILGLMLLFVFITYMQSLSPEEKWIPRKIGLYVLIAIPALALFSSFWGQKRFGDEYKRQSITEEFTAFFYNQGVTSYVVKRAYEYEGLIPDQMYTSEFLYSGLPAILSGKEVIHGNNIEHATKGNSFTHALGYIVLGDAYLAGAGTGSSYIAELYFDFGYFGIIIGSILYGWLLALFYVHSRSRHIFIRALLFIVFTRILWACRASFTGFLSYAFSPITILTLLVLFGLSSLISRRSSTSQLGVQ